MLKDFFTNDEDNVSVINTNIFSVIDDNKTESCEDSNCKEQISLKDSCVNDFPLAMAYVPMQKFEKIYCPEEGLNNGTLFEALNLPFCGYRRDGGRSR